MAMLGLGTATFIPGYGLGASATVPGAAIIRRAAESGVGYIDTAGAYADAEATLGGAINDLRKRGTRIATKIAFDPGSSPDEIRRRAVESLNRLGVVKADTILIHNASARHFADADGVDGLQALRRAGFADRIGASTYGVDDAATALSQDWCDVVQVEHSILNQSVVPAIRAGKRPDQEIVARSVLCKGLLTGRRALAGGVPGDVQRALEATAARAAEWGFTMSGLAIRCALDTPGVDVVIVGVSSLVELDDALEAAARPALSSDQLAELAMFDCSTADIVHPERWVPAAH